MEQKEQEAIEKGMRMLWIIWGAMVVSLVMYIGICYYLAEQLRTRSSPVIPVEMMRNIFYGITVLSLIGAHFLRKSILRGKIKLGNAKLSQVTPGQDQPPFVMKYFSAVMISLAISESIGLYGFVLFFLSGDFTNLYILMAISAAAMFYFRPKREELKELATAMVSTQGVCE